MVIISTLHRKDEKCTLSCVGFVVNNIKPLMQDFFCTGLSALNVVSFLFVLLLSADFNKKHF